MPVETVRDARVMLSMIRDTVKELGPAGPRLLRSPHPLKARRRRTGSARPLCSRRPPCRAQSVDRSRAIGPAAGDLVSSWGFDGGD